MRIYVGENDKWKWQALVRSHRFRSSLTYDIAGVTVYRGDPRYGVVSENPQRCRSGASPTIAPSSFRCGHRGKAPGHSNAHTGSNGASKAWVVFSDVDVIEYCHNQSRQNGGRRHGDEAGRK